MNWWRHVRLQSKHHPSTFRIVPPISRTCSSRDKHRKWDVTSLTWFRFLPFDSMSMTLIFRAVFQSLQPEVYVYFLLLLIKNSKRVLIFCHTVQFYHIAFRFNATRSKAQKNVHFTSFMTSRRRTRRFYRMWVTTARCWCVSRHCRVPTTLRRHRSAHEDQSSCTVSEYNSNICTLVWLRKSLCPLTCGVICSGVCQPVYM